MTYQERQDLKACREHLRDARTALDGVSGTLVDDTQAMIQGLIDRIDRALESE